MYKNKKFLAIIPARGGSKRLPKKNILKLNGKELLAYSIEAGLESKYIDKVIVSSEDDNILDIAKRYKADTIKRAYHLAQDTTTTFDSIKQILEDTNGYDYIVLLQPTSPLRTNKHIDEAIEQLFEKECDAIIGVCETEHTPLMTNILDESLSMDNFLDESVVNKRGQDLPKYYRINGAIYICDIKRVLKDKRFIFKNNIYAYIMDRYSSVDIDEKIDFLFAELVIKNKNSIEIK